MRRRNKGALPRVGCRPPSVDEKMAPAIKDQVRPPSAPCILVNLDGPLRMGWVYLFSHHLPTHPPKPPIHTHSHTPLSKSHFKGGFVVGCGLGAVVVRCGGKNKERATLGAATCVLEGYLSCGSQERGRRPRASEHDLHEDGPPKALRCDAFGCIWGPQTPSPKLGGSN